MDKFKLVLGIETSCDDTSVCLLRGDGFVIGQKSANQDSVHRPFGGIVPEIASRNHTIYLLPMVNDLLNEHNLKIEDINGIAATNRPGLLGSLLVGLVTAKTLALCLDIPWVGVHHIEGHIQAPFLKDKEYNPPENWSFPFLSLVVSGGHTSLYKVSSGDSYELIGSTIDDAAGEAFDKFAKMLGLSYPGGVQIDRLAKEGIKNQYKFPRALLNEDNFDFSFSGLKTAAHRELEKMSKEQIQKEINHLCASYQESIVDVLVQKTIRAAKKHNIKNISLTGGVSANSRLREALEVSAKENKFLIAIPPLRYCTDNASMIALAGLRRLTKGERSDFSEGVLARATI